MSEISQKQPIRISAKTHSLIKQVNQVIKENVGSPFTLRQIYYQLVSKGYFENIVSNYKLLSRACVKGRELRLIPEEAFVDRMRPFRISPQWEGPSDFLNDIRTVYRKNIWENQPNYVEVWLEKDALLGVIQPVADYFYIGLQGGRGYVSYTVAQEAAVRFQKAYDANKKCYLLYAGDFDPSGINIYDALIEKLENRHNIDFVEPKRIALTKEQVEHYNLPRALPKRTDSRIATFVAQHGDIAVELDALPPKVFCKLVQNEISILVDWDLFKTAQKIERTDQKNLNKIISGINNSS